MLVREAGKEQPMPSRLGKKCHVPSRAQGCAHHGESCLLAFQRPPRPSVPCAGKKPQLTAQTKNKQVSGKKTNKKNAKSKNLPAQKKKKPASKPNKKDTKVNTICPD